MKHWLFDKQFTIKIPNLLLALSAIPLINYFTFAAYNRVIFLSDFKLTGLYQHHSAEYPYVQYMLLDAGFPLLCSLCRPKLPG